MKFIEGARLWPRRWSTWLAAAFGTVVVTVTNAPSLFLGLLAMFPGGWRIFLSGVLFALCVIVPVLTVNLKQKKLEGIRDEQSE